MQRNTQKNTYFVMVKICDGKNITCMSRKLETT